MVRLACIAPACIFFASVLACAPNRTASPPSQQDARDGDAAPPGSPLISVTGDAIALDGAFLVDPRPIESGASLHRIDALFVRLKGRRDGASEPKPDEQWVDARTGGAVATASALMTAAWAGYPHVHVRTGSAWVDGRAARASHRDPRVPAASCARRSLLPAGR